MRAGKGRVEGEAQQAIFQVVEDGQAVYQPEPVGLGIEKFNSALPFDQQHRPARQDGQFHRFIQVVGQLDFLKTAFRRSLPVGRRPTGLGSEGLKEANRPDQGKGSGLQQRVVHYSRSKWEFR